MPPAESMLIPSGPSPSAQIRRFDSEPSVAMSKADNRPANDSEIAGVEPSGVITIPLGKSMSPATSWAVPSRSISRIQPGSGGAPPAKSKSAPLT